MGSDEEKTEKSEDATFEGTDEEHEAAAKIQAMHRGRKGRKKHKKKKDAKVREWY